METHQGSCSCSSSRQKSTLYTFACAIYVFFMCNRLTFTYPCRSTTTFGTSVTSIARCSFALHLLYSCTKISRHVLFPNDQLSGPPQMNDGLCLAPCFHLFSRFVLKFACVRVSAHACVRACLFVCLVVFLLVVCLCVRALGFCCLPAVLRLFRIMK